MIQCCASVADLPILAALGAATGDVGGAIEAVLQTDQPRKPLLRTTRLCD